MWVLLVAFMLTGDRIVHDQTFFATGEQCEIDRKEVVYALQSKGFHVAAICAFATGVLQPEGRI